jgi:hypothetical protein
MRAPLETVTSKKETANEGRTKRCLYLFASCSVDEPYSWTYLKSAFITIEPMMRAMEAARTNWGLILTPSVSSSKKRSRPALDAGIGAFFFLLLIVGWPLRSFWWPPALLKYVVSREAIVRFSVANI